MANENVLNPEALELQNQPEDEAGKVVPEEAAQEIPPQESEQTAGDTEADAGTAGESEQTAKAEPAEPEEQAVPAEEPAEPAAQSEPENEAEAPAEPEEPEPEVTETSASEPAEDDDYFTVEPDETDTFADADEEIPIAFEAVEPDVKKSGRIADTVQQVRSGIQEKYEEARSACKNLMDRLSYDLEQTNYNPYIRSTTTYRYEILKKSSDTEPVDVFEFERTTGYSLRAMAITTVLVAAADVAVARLLKKKLF